MTGVGVLYDGLLSSGLNTVVTKDVRNDKGIIIEGGWQMMLLNIYIHCFTLSCRVLSVKIKTCCLY
jgi:hypothetical protein